MRLVKIRIAGFKSFVDPMTLELRSPLVGIVGPNGCGKSNTIDAVRWVMGESSAKHLRGQSLEDVIFNGSSARKPVGQASVELVFDNSAGKLGGEYAQYQEIALKRVASRDGKSAYYLNGTRCRRRDITDIFLGTGLGPRSYAIIEQGMISRLIEAKPDELRTTLEEAAGISRYKERRRETETRISHTRDNLERLNDIRSEVAKQLTKLEKQAAAATQYQTLRTDEQHIAAQVMLLQLEALEQAEREQLAQLSAVAEYYKAQWQVVREQEQLVEQLREQVKEANQQFNQVQGDYYEAGAVIARLEQQLRHQNELKERQQQSLSQLESALVEAREHQAEDLAALASNQSEIESLSPQLPLLEQRRQTLEAEYLQAQQRLNQWQKAWNELQAHIEIPTRTVQSEQAKLGQLERQQVQLQQRQSRLEQELGSLKHTDTEEERLGLTEEWEETKQRRIELETELNSLQTAIPAQRSQIQTLQTQLAQVRLEYEQAQAQWSALTTLQQAQLHNDSNERQQWLATKGWSSAPRLAEILQVEEGWEVAIETVLSEVLDAVCIEQLQRQIDSGWPKQGVSLIQTQGKSNEYELKPLGELLPLATKVLAPITLHEQLAAIYCVDSLAEAFQHRMQLAIGQSIITPDGFWLGRYWLKSPRAEVQELNTLQRQQLITELQTVTQVQRQQLSGLQAQLNTAQQLQYETERQLQALQNELNQLQRLEAKQNQALNNLLQQQQQIAQQRQRIEQDLAELQQFKEEYRFEAEEAREHLVTAQLALENLSTERQTLQAEQASLQNVLEHIQTQRHAAQHEQQHLVLKLDTLQSQLGERTKQLDRVKQRLATLVTQYEQLQMTLQAQVEPLQEGQSELEIAREARALVEIRLHSARKAMEQAEQAVIEQDRKRLQAEQLLDKLRSEQEQLKLNWQALQVKTQDLSEQFHAFGLKRETLHYAIATENLQGLQQHLNQVRVAIAKLGAINLAAIEEFQQLTERKNYLDTQYHDLIEALDTLEAVMKKIDRETRTRFKETFEQVNTQLSQMFMRLFGGGECYLHMTENDWLTTGVAIMVRPPGKRISHIQLLSGGEKALTAVALVFAIFALNPAPFCMLDEVDAPLDEANVGRFAELVRHMSAQVQFIFITHNRVTMELAENLIGVTMREPGVSRLVAVDVTEAAQLANQ
ncbi:MAG: chromosome segregation protein SMC [Thiofilum sp.]|uniref:chromosome segregation protein SMC n=1 Tax=Thiofilum sp. TaxID=2212733 RepID=UPI0025E24518|nr:chromosome segregation protein SMC [Thiofilum sp.]MBK8453795.1 chromosome segregation protein SMC [Thiofilum sp.]